MNDRYLQQQLRTWVTDEIVGDMTGQLEEVFRTVIFRPLVLGLRKFTVQTPRLNSVDAVREAIRQGKVQYEPGTGILSGQFNSSMTRYLMSIGATWDNRRKVFRFPPKDAPLWLQSEAAAYSLKAQDAHKFLLSELDKIRADGDKLIDLAFLNPKKMTDGMQNGYRRVSEAIGIKADLSDDAKERIGREYTSNLKLHVKDFTKKMTDSLRDITEENATAGYRYDRLTKDIETRYGVSKSKAEFLARQETTLFMSSHRRARFADGGIRQYMWVDSNDERVRHDHKRLRFKIFSYDDPPVVDLATGKKANPGEDFGCRCEDRPVVGGAKLMQEAMG